MATSENPYMQSGLDVADCMPSKSDASVVWFFVAAIFANSLGVASQLIYNTWAAREQFYITSFRQVVIPFAIALAIATVCVLVYVAIGSIRRRMTPATKISRVMAALVFCVIIWTWMILQKQLDFPGPPGLISLPLGGVASVITDRLFARAWRRSFATNLGQPS